MANREELHVCSDRRTLFFIYIYIYIYTVSLFLSSSYLNQVPIDPVERVRVSSPLLLLSPSLFSLSLSLLPFLPFFFSFSFSFLIVNDYYYYFCSYSVLHKLLMVPRTERTKRRFGMFPFSPFFLSFLVRQHWEVKTAELGSRSPGHSDPSARLAPRSPGRQNPPISIPLGPASDFGKKRKERGGERREGGKERRKPNYPNSSSSSTYTF